MKHPNRQYEQMEVPRLRPEIKDMNGKSTRKLTKCIKALSDLLDEHDPEEHYEEGSDSSPVRPDAE